MHRSPCALTHAMAPQMRVRPPLEQKKGTGRFPQHHFSEGGRTREWVPQERQNRPGNRRHSVVPTTSFDLAITIATSAMQPASFSTLCGSFDLTEKQGRFALSRWQPLIQLGRCGSSPGYAALCSRTDATTNYWATQLGDVHVALRLLPSTAYSCSVSLHACGQQSAIGNSSATVQQSPVAARPHAHAAGYLPPARHACTCCSPACPHS